jgi:hypothetical protein
MIATTFPLLEARGALELLATGTVEGKIVLEASEVLSPGLQPERTSPRADTRPDTCPHPQDGAVA